MPPSIRSRRARSVGDDPALGGVDADERGAGLRCSKTPTGRWLSVSPPVRSRRPTGPTQASERRSHARRADSFTDSALSLAPSYRCGRWSWCPSRPCDLEWRTVNAQYADPLAADPLFPSSDLWPLAERGGGYRRASRPGRPTRCQPRRDMAEAMRALREHAGSTPS